MHRAKTCSHKSNYDGGNMVESLSKIEDETVCDEGVNIILLTNKYKILIIEAETNANIDTTCMKTVSGEKWFFILWNAWVTVIWLFLAENYLNLVMTLKNLFKI